MAVVMKETEGLPGAYPEITWDTLSDAIRAHAAPKKRAGEDAWVWARIEAYTRLRIAERAVTWVVSGPGEFEVPLTPVTITTRERWVADSMSWTSWAGQMGPTGAYVLDPGVFKFVGTAGPLDPIPGPVKEAAARLSNYLLHAIDTPNAHVSETRTAFDENGRPMTAATFTRSRDWLASSLVLSGAADLLRPYRRVP